MLFVNVFCIQQLWVCLLDLLLNFLLLMCFLNKNEKLYAVENGLCEYRTNLSPMGRMYLKADKAGKIRSRVA